MVHIGYAIGLSFGFFQMLYLDYKLNKNFEKQLQETRALRNWTSTNILKT